MCFFTTLLCEIANVALNNVLRSAANGFWIIFKALFLLKYITFLLFIIADFYLLTMLNTKRVPHHFQYGCITDVNIIFGFLGQWQGNSYALHTQLWHTIKQQ
jgi:hypothetical protein